MSELSPLQEHSGHPTESVRYPVRQSSVQKKFARHALPRGGANVMGVVLTGVMVEEEACGVIVDLVWLTVTVGGFAVVLFVTP